MLLGFEHMTKVHKWSMGLFLPQFFPQLKHTSLGLILNSFLLKDNRFFHLLVYDKTMSLLELASSIFVDYLN